jgi:hypothetical protein
MRIIPQQLLERDLLLLQEDGMAVLLFELPEAFAEVCDFRFFGGDAGLEEVLGGVGLVLQADRLSLQGQLVPHLGDGLVQGPQLVVHFCQFVFIFLG